MLIHTIHYTKTNLLMLQFSNYVRIYAHLKSLGKRLDNILFESTNELIIPFGLQKKRSLIFMKSFRKKTSTIATF